MKSGVHNGRETATVPRAAMAARAARGTCGTAWARAGSVRAGPRPGICDVSYGCVAAPASSLHNCAIESKRCTIYKNILGNLSAKIRLFNKKLKGYVCTTVHPKWSNNVDK